MCVINFVAQRQVFVEIFCSTSENFDLLVVLDKMSEGHQSDRSLS